MTRSHPPAATKRIRLAPEVRSEKVLDSALAEFSRHGFAATRIEDIARGAGLAKSGFYAHFRSKEDIFEALMTHYLVTDEVVPFGEGDTAADFIDRFLDLWYSRLADPHRQASLRLLLVEANRIPELVNQWRQVAMESEMERQLDVLRGAVARGQLAPGPILGYFQFVYSPIFHWVLKNGLLDPCEGTIDKTLDLHRELHRQMLLALLRAPGQTQEASCPANGSSS
jgi:AcrR family transcriptional regulator